MNQTNRRHTLAASAAAGACLAILAPATATGAPEHETIKAKVRNGDFAYVPSRTEIERRGTITLRNRTDAPHTFSIVKQEDVPETRKQQQRCFRRGHICRRIFKWHDRGERRRVNAGVKGFNTGGDSVFFSDRARAKITADEGRTLNFICGLHPQMQGKLHVR
jgi:plastocyanin